MTFVYIGAAGLFVGIIVGISGVGGSALLAPILILLLGIKPSVAIGTDLLYSVPTKLFALVLHARQKTIDWSLTRLLLAGGVPGAIGGLAAYAMLSTRIAPEQLQPVMRHAIGFAILLACVGATFTWIMRSGHAPSRDQILRPPSSVAMIAIGLLVGFLVSLTSIGAGSVTLPLLILVAPGIVLRRLIGSEIAFAAFLLPLAATGHIAFGDVSWRSVAALLLGALPGVWIGSRLYGAINDAWLRPIILGVLAFAGSRLI